MWARRLGPADEAQGRARSKIVACAFQSKVTVLAPGCPLCVLGKRATGAGVYIAGVYIDVTDAAAA